MGGLEIIGMRGGRRIGVFHGLLRNGQRGVIGLLLFLSATGNGGVCLRGDLGTQRAYLGGTSQAALVVAIEVGSNDQYQADAED